MVHILESALYALIFLGVGLPLLALAYYILDVITPGHKIGARLVGTTETNVKQGVALTKDDASYSAGIVTSAWMIMQAAIIFTAVWTNAHGTDLGAALGWTVAFSLIGLFLQSVAFVVLDALTPGNLSDEVCAPGRATPLAWVTAANIVAVGIVVISVIS